jgi:peptidyl-prolyl cis-trans isomerase D
MISVFREFTKSWAFKIVMALLVLSFLVFGINDIFNPSLSNSVIKAGNREVSATQFKTEFDTYKKSLEQENGGKPILIEDAVKSGLHMRILDDYARKEAFNAWLEKAGIRPSAALVVEQIRKVPRFFNQITSQFDRSSYQAALRENNLTETEFESRIKDDIATQHFGSAAVANLKPSKIMAALQTSLALEGRDAEFFIYDGRTLPVPAAPNDKDLLAFYNDKKSLLKQPEMRQFTVISFAPADFEATIVPDEADLRKLYAFKRDTLVKPETRSFIQITAKDVKTANRISLALKSGQDPAAVAKAKGAEVITYGDKPRTAVADKKIADVAFGLKIGEVSEPVQGDLGLGVVKLNAVQAASATSFEQIRESLKAEVRRQKANEKVYALVDEIEKDRKAGTDLLTAAEKLKVRITPLPPMNAEGQAVNGQSFAQFDNIIKVAFDQPSGGESEIEDMGNGEYYALKVNQVMAAHTPRLEDIKPQMIEAFISNKLSQDLQDNADKLSSRLNKGEAMANVATAATSRVVLATGLNRQNALQKLNLSADNPRISQELASRIFSAKKGEAVSLQISPYQFVFGKVTNILPASYQQAVQQMPMAQAMGGRDLINDISSLSLAGAGQSIKVKTYPKTAIKALGINPDDLAPDREAKEKNAKVKDGVKKETTNK